MTPRPLGTVSLEEHDQLRRRTSITTATSACGYLDGNPSSARIAGSGYDCRFDTANGLWGFCPTTVIAATDCGFAGYCYDTGDCLQGCGSPNSGLTTFQCTHSNGPYCSTALLTFGIDQTYSYIACGTSAVTVHYNFAPTSASSSGTSASGTSTYPGSIQIVPISASTSSLLSTGTSTCAESSQTIPIPASTSTGTMATSTSSSASTWASSVNTRAIVGGVVGALAVVCACIVAVVYIWSRGKARSAAQPVAAQMSGNPEHESLRGYGNATTRPSTTRVPSLSPGMPASRVWRELPELPGDHHQRDHSGLSEP
ncbi:hypothetical protein VM1G_11764 [Cytospora mali]|uniref:Uncharacterized protein n=1 Tax=Cytospora mali TaxID=578113 RepID=A0A194W465_CYTMA|nr:hypothetical protein VM1G_11764 [Valsa mali]